MKRCFALLTLGLLPLAWSYNTPLCRRALMRRTAAAWIGGTTTASPPTTVVAVPSSPALAAATEDPRDSIRQAQSTLSTLLDNWQRATVDCTFADVPRELLQQKNKELLLEKASTYALFDKSVSVETCKTTNQIVRDYLGVTGKGPLLGMEKKLKLALDNVNVDRLEDYIAEMESFQYSMNQAASLSYMSATADFDAVNNFAKDDVIRKEDSALEQARKAIVDARTSLDRMAGMLDS